MHSTIPKYASQHMQHVVYPGFEIPKWSHLGLRAIPKVKYFKAPDKRKKMLKHFEIKLKTLENT